MKVRLTRPADRDLQRILDFVAQDSPAAASALVERLIDRTFQLGNAPESGRRTDEPGVRVITVPDVRYFIFYQIKNGEVHILHIRHTSRRRLKRWR